MKKNILILSLLLVILGLGYNNFVYAQEEEPILYYQMEPFDDSLFIKIQEEVFIDPPDPKSEIIIDLRDANNQTVSIKGALYPYLAFTPETRARIQTYPFKLNLEEDIHYGSVFTRVFEKMRFGKLLAPPTKSQIVAGYAYVNPFFQVFGGERFGVPIKSDIGLSFGLGTPYSGPFETNMIEANFHILGFSGGFFSHVDALVEAKTTNNHNNIFVTQGFQVAYVIPFGNFLQIGYTGLTENWTRAITANYQRFDTLNFHAKLVNRSFFNWEFRYPFSFLGSTRAKFYLAQYLNEWHIGFTGRELSMAGSTFDFRFDAMPKSDIRQPQYVFDILVQKVFDSWGFSAFSIGPSAILTKTNKGTFGVTSLFVNMRLKVGTSL
ncbi:MAG: hypothetical protein ACM3O3_08500 [Syntrophothermus sp.]|nr:hypothetical protein [Ignavibacteriaceae bacterium]